MGKMVSRVVKDGWRGSKCLLVCRGRADDVMV